MKIWMIPAKGKGCEVTARNIAKGDESDLARPLTTDPWDNALLLYEEQETDEDNEEGG